MPRSRVYMLFILVCLVFSTTFLAIRIGILAGSSPILFAGLRFAIAGLLMCAGLWMFRRFNLKTIASLLPRALLISVFLTSGTFGSMYWAESRIDSGYMARLDTLGPIVTSILSLIILRSPIRTKLAIGLGLGALGGILLAGGSGGGGAEAIYLIVALAGVLAYAAGLVLYPKLFDSKADTLLVNALQMLMGGIVLLFLSPLIESPALSLSVESLGSLAYLIFIGSVLAHSANLVVVREAGPVFASAWLYAAPPLATLAGALVLKESLGLIQALGTLAAMVGVVFVSRSQRTRLE